MKKIVRAICLILAVMMLFSLTACKKSVPTVMTYKDKNLTSGQYAFALASIKGNMVDYFKTSGGQDIESDKTFWESSFQDSTYQDWLKDYSQDLCKNMLIANYYCDLYKLNITDETTIKEIDSYVDKAKEQFGGEDELALELAKYGITSGQMREYFEYYYRYQLLMDYWYGEKGTMKIPADEVKTKFYANYYKVDMAAFGFYTTDESNNKVPVVDTTITDAQAKDYFSKNYVKAQHILFMTVDTNGTALSADKIAEAEKNANDTYNAIKNGTATFEDKLKDSENASDPMVFTHGEMVTEFEDASFSMKSGDIQLVKTKYGYHIIKKLTTTDDDFNGKIDAVKQAMSKANITAKAKDMFEQLKNNKIEFKDGGTNAVYQFTAGQMLSAESTDENVIKAISAIKPGEYTLYEMKNGTTTVGYYIFKRAELTDTDLSSNYSTVENGMKQQKYTDYVKTFYDSITINQDELKKSNDNLVSLKSFPVVDQ